ncbi:MAG: HlyD family type I secretion periplasmic adaptor subunit [Desulfomicrobium sp.]|nr:HlyD family type I secretion periplasmic adaptor subunit [Desulfomicrobium sp.]
MNTQNSMAQAIPSSVSTDANGPLPGSGSGRCRSGSCGRPVLARGYAGELKDITSTSRVAANILLLVVVLFFIVAVFWASHAPLDEVVRGTGKVIPSSEVKRIQNFEGGIVKEILVREGEQVAKGQLLILLDQVQMTSKFREQQSGYLDQVLAIARLEAELEGRDEIDFPEEVMTQKPHLIEHQRQLLRSRKESRISALSVLEREREQRSQELKELRSRLDYQQQNYSLLKKEVEMTRTMVAKGAASDMDLLRAQRELTDLSGQIADSRIAIPKVAAAVEGAIHRIDEEKGKQRSEMLNELNAIRTEMEGTKEKLPALEDQMDRTSVRSPVDGTVKRVFVTTIGEAVGPGKEMLEIVPREDTLLIEAKVLPQDIAFLYPGQPADVKITAYDFSIYGGMPAVLEHISADAITDEQQKISYYLIKVRTEQTTVKDKSGKEMPIIPGMVAEVDVLTGKKTVLEYILKPIIKTTRGALRER